MLLAFVPVLLIRRVVSSILHFICLTRIILYFDETGFSSKQQSIYMDRLLIVSGSFL